MTEAKVRRVLKSKSIILRKDRARNWSWNLNGGYMLIGFSESGNEFILDGENYDLTLDDVINEYVLK